MPASTRQMAMKTPTKISPRRGSGEASGSCSTAGDSASGVAVIGLRLQIGMPILRRSVSCSQRMSEISRKAASFTESVIREMTRLAMAHDAVNLAQGFPDFACPPELKEAAKAAIDADINQYAITWGARDFREAIAAKTTRFYPDWPVDPETEITVTCGATEGMIAAMMAVLDPGDEVIVFEPYYENYGPDAILSGAVPRYVTLHEPDWRIDPDELRERLHPSHPGHRPQLAAQPDRQGLHARRARDDRPAVRHLRRRRLHRRHLRAHRLRRRAHPAGHDSRHARADRGRQLAVQDVLRDRLARRLGDRSAAPDERDPQGPRLPDRRCRRPAPGCRRRRPGAARRLLHRPGRWLPRAPRCPGCGARDRRLPHLAARTAPTT